MPVIPWNCAHGEAPSVLVRCDGPTVEIAPYDDSVDSNSVLVHGPGTIYAFGPGPPIVKRVMFSPGITLKHNPPILSLLTCQDRVIATPAVGTYARNGDGQWSEIHFSATGSAEVSRRMDALESRLAELERRYETQVAEPPAPGP